MALKFARLTRPAIRTLERGDKIIEHGICAERQSSGDVRFSINIMVDGQRVHRVVGRESEGVTREQAERAIESIRTAAREGRLDLPAGRKLHRSFAEHAAEYLVKIEHHAKHGRNLPRKRRHIERLSRYFKTQRLDKLTDFAIALYARQRREEGAAVATINRELSTLSHLLNRALEWRWIKSKPKIDKATETPKQIVILSADQKQKLMRAAEGDQDPLTWLFAAIAMGTGMRHSEILRLRWDEMQFDLCRIHIGKAKAGQRVQPMSPSLSERLSAEWRQLGEPAGYVFPTSRADAKHPHRTTMAEQFRRSVERAGLNPERVTPHVLRHTAITELVQAGVPLPTIQKVSGHKTLAMILKYTHLSDAHVDQAVAKLDGAFSDTFTPELHTGARTAGKGAA